MPSTYYTNSTFAPPPCCKRSGYVTMDYMYLPGWDRAKGIPVTHRCCPHCMTHWFGYRDDIKRYTRKEWDAKIQHGFNETKTN